jgi:hypothetical protein
MRPSDCGGMGLRDVISWENFLARGDSVLLVETFLESIFVVGLCRLRGTWGHTP